MKRIIALFLSISLLCLTGCGGKDYAVARAAYPKLTDYAEAYETVAKYEQSGMVTMEKMDDAYNDLYDAMSAYNDELRALRAEAEGKVPDLTDFTAQTTAAMFAGREVNTVYSPVNLYLALAMLSEATGGDTRSEVTALMGTDDPRTAANAVWKMLYSDGRGKVIPANSMWTGERYPVKQSLADTLSKDYYADSFTVPMGTPEADEAMQTWVNDHTGNLLQEAAEGIHTDPLTVLTLISTLYFEQMWSDKFHDGSTSPDIFTAADGREITTDFMHAGGTGAWYRGENYVMAGRSFQDNGGRMVFILPDEGVLPEQLLTDGDTLTEILTAGHDQYTRINWAVPKFDVSSDLELSRTLQALGIQKAFDADVSDYTPTTEDTAVELSQVQHAARVTIDENGCTAAAFTVMMMNAGTAMPPDEILEMNLNRPFAFVIFSDTGLPLFMGTVYEP